MTTLLFILSAGVVLFLILRYEEKASEKAEAYLIDYYRQKVDHRRNNL